ncbi:MAG: TonB family protein [Candidatus Sulfotelmatobacter sp.]
MPITQIPFRDPVPPPPPSPEPQPEQLGLYDSDDWETAYRELDARVPHLLIQLQDDLARSRRREAAWISIVGHLVLFILLWNLPLIEKTIGIHRAVVIPINPMQDKNVTFLPLPPDLQKPTRKPNTNVMSDKDRIAMSRHPQLDPNELRKILTPPPGAPGAPGPRSAQPAAPPQPAPSQAPPQQTQQATTRPQIQSNQTAQLQTPARPNNNFSKFAAPMTAGQAIQQATQAAATNHGGGGQGGDFGLGTGQRGRQLGQLDILSDTQGVDFGPYLQRILQVVRQNWEVGIPESAKMGKKGKLAIEFAITKDGKVADMRLVASSGDAALDRPAWGSITLSDPFPPLPTEFRGPYLALRFRYYYNPDKADLE